MTTYYESAEDVQISRKRALKEIGAHGHYLCTMDAAQFFEECGDRESYDAQEVLNWLGY